MRPLLGGYEKDRLNTVTGELFIANCWNWLELQRIDFCISLRMYYVGKHKVR